MHLPIEVCDQVVTKIIEDLRDRRGLRQEWDAIDPDVQEEIKESWMYIVENFGD